MRSAGAAPPGGAPPETGRPGRSPWRRRVVAVALVGAVWLGARAVFWLGWANGDDIVYATYAWHFDRPPADHREFRLLPVLAMRAAMQLVGPTEAAAALPSLVGSLLLTAAAAWFLGWPRRADAGRTWAMLLAVTVPLDVGMASHAGASHPAAGLAALGTAGLLRGAPRGRFAGAVLLGLAVASHELMVFWVVALAAATWLVDRDRWQVIRWPLLAAVAVPVAVEAATWAALAGRPWARWTVAAGETARTSGALLDGHADRLGFVLRPLRAFAFSRQFAFDLLLLAALGLGGWRRLEGWQRAVLGAVVVYWLWLHYGTPVPWAYRPRIQSFHSFVVLTAPVAAVIGRELARRWRSWPARAAVASMVALHLAALAAGGRWGQSVEVSRALLDYARSRPEATFVTDAHTLAEMTAVNRLVPPANVVTLAGREVYRSLLPSRAPYRERAGPAPEVRVDAALVNGERAAPLGDAAFTAFLAAARTGAVEWRLPPRLKPALAPLAAVLGARGWMTLHEGGWVVALPERPWNRPVGLEQGQAGRGS